MDDTIKELIGAVSLLITLFAVGAEVVICGALQNNDILFDDAVKYGLMVGVVMILGVIGIKYTEDDRDTFSQL